MEPRRLLLLLLFMILPKLLEEFPNEPIGAPRAPIGALAEPPITCPPIDPIPNAEFLTGAGAFMVAVAETFESFANVVLLLLSADSFMEVSLG